MRYALTFCLIVSGTALTGRQAPPLAFDVVSIRQNTSGATGGGSGPGPGGIHTFTNVLIRSVISFAYDVPSSRLIGGPGWLVTDRYDISARGKDGATRDETSQMLRAMLRDRFRLAARVEKRDLPVYHLVLARADGRLGSGMRRSPVNCLDPEARKKAYAAALPNSRIVCGLQDGAGSFTGGGVEVATIASVLTGASGRPVLDRTGLSGGFDVDLRWTPSLAGDAAPPDVVSIFTAVQEQLGLKLENATAPLDVLVIDRIERPSEN
jgi:uncharacterized protein (TIGR03435 family)